MVILNRKMPNRKAAEQNPASTAALRRVAINLSSQRRALRHPAGAHRATLIFREIGFPIGHGEPSGAAVTTSGLKNGVPRESVCGRAMICIHCRVPTTSSSLTTNQKFLRDFLFVFWFDRDCAGRFRRTSRARACAARVGRVAEKQSELRELE
jgi:hypothetical protein